MRRFVLLPALGAFALRAFAQPAPVAPAINQLGLDLLRADAAGPAPGNVLLSPYSVATALAMAWAGADGATRKEMRRVLHLNGADAGVIDGFGALARGLRDLQDASRRREAAESRNGVTWTPIELGVANRMFLQSGFALRAEFTGVLRDQFGAPLEELDFRQAAEPARNCINSWVGRETHDRISDLIPAGALGDSTKIVLANAIYLRAPWTDPFESAETKPEPFWIAGATRADVPTMHQRAHYPCEPHDGFTALALPYADGELQFLILLPDQRDGLARLERQVTASLLAACCRLPRRDVDLHLPKFKLAPPARSLKRALVGLGMTTAFDQPRGSANFDRMAPRRPGDYLGLSDLFHQAWLSLDEEGTEATAASTLTLSSFGVRAGPPIPPIEVRVDRPFLFAIQEVASGACLFLGRVADPQ